MQLVGGAKTASARTRPPGLPINAVILPMRIYRLPFKGKLTAIVLFARSVDECTFVRKKPNREGSG